MFNDSPQTGCAVPMTFVGSILAGVFFFVLLVLLFMSGWGAPGRPVPIPPGPGAGGGQPQGAAPARAERNTRLVQLGDSHIAGGSATASVSGSMTMTDQVSVDTVSSYVNRGMAWLGFGALVGGTGATDILVVLNEPEDSVTVAQGSQVVIGRDDDCVWNVQVTGSSLSGSVTCAVVEVLQDGKPAGTSSIDLRFSTTLTVVDEGGSGEDPYENLPTDEPATE